MSTFLTQVNGFTPVIDAVVADAGLNEALVYGMIWRYCRMSDGICRASTTTIGTRLGLSRRTVQRCIARLIELGYLTDKSPGLKNRPHIYADTGLVRIRGLMDVTDPTDPTASRAICGAAPESHTTAPESRSETIPLRQSGAVTASESPMSRLFKRDKEPRDESRDAGPPTPSQPPLDAIEWEMVKNDLRLQMTAAVFDTWVKPTSAHRDGDTLIIQPHNRFAYEWLSMRLRPTIANTVREVCGPKTTITFQKAADK
jgi:hypothetical protein